MSHLRPEMALYSYCDEVDNLIVSKYMLLVIYCTGFQGQDWVAYAAIISKLLTPFRY